MKHYKRFGEMDSQLLLESMSKPAIKKLKWISGDGRFYKGTKYCLGVIGSEI